MRGLVPRLSGSRFDTALESLHPLALCPWSSPPGLSRGSTFSIAAKNTWMPRTSRGMTTLRVFSEWKRNPFRCTEQPWNKSGDDDDGECERPETADKCAAQSPVDTRGAWTVAAVLVER